MAKAAGSARAIMAERLAMVLLGEQRPVAVELFQRAVLEHLADRARDSESWS